MLSCKYFIIFLNLASGLNLRGHYKHFGHEYEWSKYSPSHLTEILKSEIDKEEVKRILTRTVGASISLANKGYWMRQPPFGFSSKRVATADGEKRSVLVPHETESVWVIKAYELKAQGILSKREIVDKINAMGYKSRIILIRDKDGNPIGQRGATPMTIKSFDRIIERVTNAGMICESWTHFQPILAKFNGLVSVKLFNEANKGKKRIIVHEDGTVSILDLTKENAESRVGQVKRKNNPDFPFKNFVLCPKCKKPFMASFSRGKSGKRFPSYHCSRGHKRVAFNKHDFEETIKNVISELEFTPQYLKLLEKGVIDVWSKKVKSVRLESSKVHTNIADLKTKQQSLIDRIKRAEVTSPIVIRSLEEEIEEIAAKILNAQDNIQDVDIQEQEIQYLINHAKYFLEHLQDLFISSDDPVFQGHLFSLLFQRLPTYEELQSRTLPLQHYIKKKPLQEVDNFQMVDPLGLEPRTKGLRGLCSTN